METIDSLDIQIAGSAKKANDAINGLVSNIERLATSLKIDTSGLEKIGKTFNLGGIDKAAKNMQSQAQKTSKSLSQITEQYKDLGKGFEIKGSTQQIQKQIGTLTNKLANAKLAKEDFEKSGKINLSGYETAVKNVIKYENQIESLKNQLKSVNEIRIHPDFGNTEELIGRMKAQIQQSMSGMRIENPISIASMSEEEFAMYRRLQSEMEKTAESAEKTGEKIRKSVSSSGFQSYDSGEVQKFIDDYASASNQAENFGNKIKNVQKNTEEAVESTKKAKNETNSFADSLKKIASRADYSSKSVGGLGKNLSKTLSGMKSVTRSILSAAGIMGGFYGAIRGLKESIDISSDLTEVQNVVDKTFGDMAYKVEDFAKTSIEKFGLSELSLKQYSSRFQAMGTAMGFPTRQMSDMSIELTKLTADMASFYNVEQKAVAEDLEAIFTGQTRPLRTYGLDLTQATLQEWALKQGIDADIKSMSQAEKTMLRYQYVLENTGAAHGDFARTANTWANQVRILSQQFQQFGQVVGKGVIAAFKPFIQALNKVMEKVITFSENVLNALGKIFGWKFEITGGGITDDLGDAAGYTDDIASGAGDASDGYKDAAKNAKKLKDVVLGIDELNINAPDDDAGITGGTSGSPSGGGGLGDLGAEAGGLKTNMFKTDTILKAYESSIDDLYELGEYIGDTLTKAMESIPWDRVYEKARNFGKGLADFLNGLISPELFGETGRTIAGALNTAIYAALSFGETFDWEEFGLSIATGINEFFETFDFSSVARTINAWVNGIFDIIITAVENTNWRMIGEKIGEFIADIDILKSIGKLGKAIWEAINASIKTYAGVFSKAPVETALISLMAIPKVLKKIIDTKYIQGISKLALKFKDFASATRIAVSAFGGDAQAIATLAGNFPKLSKAVDVLGDSFQRLMFGVNFGDIKGGINAALSNISENLTKVQKGAIGAIGVFSEFSLMKSAFYDISSGSDNLAASFAKITIGAGAAVAALKLIGLSTPWTAAIAGITAAVGALTGFKQAMEEVNAERIGNSIADSLTNPGGMPLDELIENTNSSLRKVGEEFDNVSEHVNNFEKSKESIQSVLVEIDRIETSMNSGVISTEDGVEKLKNAYQGLVDAAKLRFQEYETLVFTAFADGSETTKAFESGGLAVDEYKERVTGFSSEAQSKIESLTNEILNYTATDPTNPKLGEAKEELAGLMGVTDGVTMAMSELGTYIAGNPIDWSSYINGETLDPELVITDLTSLFTAAEETQSKTSEALQGIVNSAKEAGDEENYQALRTALPGAIESSNLEVAQKVKEQTDIIKNELIGGINKQIEDANKQWEEMSVGEKAVYDFKKGSYVKEAVDSYKTEYIDPLSKEMEEGLNKLGIDGGVTAGEAAESIINSLFTKSVSHAKGKSGEAAYELKENWKWVFEESAKGLEGVSEDEGRKLGNNAVFGYKKPFTSRLGELVKAGADLVSSVTEAMANEQESHSPSKVTMGLGKDAVDGYKLGIENNSSSVRGVISTMMSSVIDWMSEGLSPIKTSLPQIMSSVWDGIKNVFSPTKEFFSNTFTNAYNAIKNAFSFVGPWFLEKWSEIKNVFRDVVDFFQKKFADAYNAIKSAFSFISNWFQDKWNSVKNVFRDVISFFRDKFTNAYNAIKSIFSPINTWFQGKWDSIKKVFVNVKTFFSDAFRNAYNAVTKIWDNIGGYFKGIANNIIAPIGKAVNGVINGINWILEKVGSGTRFRTWDVPKFASGANGLPKDTLGVVNDQVGSVYRELIIPPNGKPFIPEGRNVVLPMEKGTKIMTAKQTKALMSKMPHFAGGIGDFLSGAWEAIKGFTGNVMDYLTNPGDIVKIALDKFIDMSGWTGIYSSIASGAITKVFDDVVSYIKKIFGKIVPRVEYNPSAGVEQWRQLASYALKMTGQFTEQNLRLLLFQMQTESGGNPNAINNWDINAKMGTPSKGLMQVIDPTFRAYAMPGYDKNVYDPLSNILAAIRYTLSRYGSLVSGWKGHGYATGIGKIKISDLIPQYSAGGFPEDGLFLANHQEILGRFSNGKTAVANNYQIEKGVEEATYRGYMRAYSESRETTILEEIRDAIREGKSIQIDGREIVRVYDSRKARSGFSFT